MKQKIQHLLPYAFEALKKVGLESSTEIDNKYKGYVASFGPSLVQLGLAPTLIHYNEESEEADRKRIYKAVNAMYRQGKGIEKDLLQTVLEDQDKSSELIKEVTHYVIALKIALRTYKFKKNDN